METTFPIPDRKGGTDVTASPTVQQLMNYYWQLEQLLDRIERAQTHYQVFNISRSATVEEICKAHREVLSVLRPAYESSGPARSEELQTRIRRAIDRLCVAASVLSNLGKRVEYDNSLARRPSRPLSIDLPGVTRPEAAARVPAAPPEPAVAPQKTPQETPQEPPQAATLRDPKSVVVQDDLRVQTPASQRPVATRLVDEKQANERRRAERFKLSLPVRVTGYDRYHGKWQETATTLDVNRFGAAIQLSRRLPQGLVLHLTLPMPVKWRTHNYSSHTYSVFALVRRVERPRQGRQNVGLEFIGEHAPAGYWEQPWGIFKAAEWLGPDRRREARLSRTEPVEIEYLDEQMQPLQGEKTTTENLSRGGARIIARAAPPEFDHVRVTGLTTKYCCLATVCNRYVGKDGLERLCLNFIDARWPL